MVDLGDHFSGDFANVHDFTDGDGGEGNTVLANGDDVKVVEVAGFRNDSGLVAAGGRQGDVFDAVPWSIVAHGVNMTGEDGGDVTVFLESLVDTIPVVTIAATEPAGVVKEEEDVIGILGFFKGCIEPGKLLRAHFLSIGFSKGFFTGGRVTFVGVEDDEPGILVFEGIPKRAEVHFVGAFHFSLRAF